MQISQSRIRIGHHQYPGFFGRFPQGCSGPGKHLRVVDTGYGPAGKVRTIVIIDGSARENIGAAHKGRSRRTAHHEHFHTFFSRPEQTDGGSRTNHRNGTRRCMNLVPRTRTTSRNAGAISANPSASVRKPGVSRSAPPMRTSAP